MGHPTMAFPELVAEACRTTPMFRKVDGLLRRWAVVTGRSNSDLANARAAAEGKAEPPPSAETWINSLLAIPPRERYDFINSQGGIPDTSSNGCADKTRQTQIPSAQPSSPTPNPQRGHSREVRGKRGRGRLIDCKLLLGTLPKVLIGEIQRCAEVKRRDRRWQGKIARDLLSLSEGTFPGYEGIKVPTKVLAHVILGPDTKPTVISKALSYARSIRADNLREARQRGSV